MTRAASPVSGRFFRTCGSRSVARQGLLVLSRGDRRTGAWHRGRCGGLHHRERGIPARLPYEDADRLLVLSWQLRSGRRSNVSYSDFQDWRAASRSFEALAAHREGTANISDDRGVPEEVSGTWLTANAFNILGPRPILGRDFTTDDERVGASPVVIISSALWQRRYGGDPDVLGRVLRLNGRPATIIGVMPEGMRFRPTRMSGRPYVPAEGDLQRNTRTLRVFGRLADGADRRRREQRCTASRSSSSPRTRTRPRIFWESASKPSPNASSAARVARCSSP